MYKNITKYYDVKFESVWKSIFLVYLHEKEWNFFVISWTHLILEYTFLFLVCIDSVVFYLRVMGYDKVYWVTF